MSLDEQAGEHSIPVTEWLIQALILNSHYVLDIVLGA